MSSKEKFRRRAFSRASREKSDARRAVFLNAMALLRQLAFILAAALLVGGVFFFRPTPASAPEDSRNVTPQLSHDTGRAPRASALGTSTNPTSTLSSLIEAAKKKAPKTSFPPAPAPRITPPTDGQKFSAADCESISTGSPFYYDPMLQASRAERELRAKGFTSDADLLRDISCHASALWFGGGSPEAIKEKISAITDFSAAQGKIPLLVLYNAPAHYEAGWGTGLSASAYREWIRAAASGIGENPAWVILEPDSLSLAINYDTYNREVRLEEIRDAADIIRTSAPRARIYLDGGHSDWRSVRDQADMLIRARVVETQGFFVNVANYRLLANELTYARELSSAIGGKHFIIDTGRNGSGPSGNEWCNARGIALGKTPTRETGDPLADAFLWVKPPGESDGYCSGGPPPGKFWVEYALEMITNARKVKAGN